MASRYTGGGRRDEGRDRGDKDRRRERKPTDDRAEPRERESREIPWSEWTWSSEHNTFYRHRTGVDGHPQYEYNTQPGVSAPQSGYTDPSSAGIPHPWGAAPPATRDYDRPSQAGPAQSQWGTADISSNSAQQSNQSYSSMLPPARPTARDAPYGPSSTDGGAVLLTKGNEYFLPGEGIEREVITADICRYLDNDALVRPGNYKNPRNGQSQRGYIVTAFQPLSKENIADMKADSERWLHEKRSSRVHSYMESRVHESRAYYGPTPSHNASRYQLPLSDTRPLSSSAYPAGASSSAYGNPRENSGSGVFPPAAAGPYAQSQHYTTNSGGGTGFYPSDIHSPTGQPVAHERQYTQTQEGPRSGATTYFDSSGARTTASNASQSTGYSTTEEGSNSPYTASTTTASSTTFGHSPAPSANTSARAASSRSNASKRQRSHDPDQMDFMDES